MTIRASRASVIIPGLAAGVIYAVIALATGASAAASLAGALVVAAIAITIGLIFREAYRRKAAGQPKQRP